MTDFQQHLKRICLAKKRAGKILNVWSLAEDTTMALAAFV
jgi:hypothetical protein